MKKVFCVLMIIVFAFSSASCGDQKSAYTEDAVTMTETEVETTIKIDPTVYPECKIESLKTFTEITGAEVSSVDKSEVNNTNYTYIVTGNADEKVYEYQNYLRSIGFEMAAERAFTSPENVNFIVYAEDENTVKISVPCDDETMETRRENFYTEIKQAFDSKNYALVYDSRYDIERDYKDADFMFNYSEGMVALGNGDLYKAHKAFTECTDSAEATEHIKEIEKYNGQYKLSKNGLDFYVFIKNGRVTNEVDFNYSATAEKYIIGDSAAVGSVLGYNYGDPVVGYSQYLIVEKVPDGEEKLSIGKIEYENGVCKVTLEYSLIDNKNGKYTVKDINEDSTYYYEIGEYTKISDKAPPEK